MRTFVPFLLALAFFSAPGNGADSAPAKPRGDKAQNAAVAASPAAATPKSRSLLSRVFGAREQGKPVATPLPSKPVAATPHPRTVPRKLRDGEKPEEPVTSEKHAGTTKGPAAKVDKTQPGEKGEGAAPETASPAEGSPPEKAPDGATPAPASTEKPPVTKHGRHKKGSPVEGEATSKEPAKELTKEQVALQQATASGNPDAIEKAKFDEVKSRAAADPHIQELRQKANEAGDDVEGRKALRSYNKALFQKMRSLGDESVQDRIERMESAVLKNLGGAE